MTTMDAGVDIFSAEEVNWQRWMEAATAPAPQIARPGKGRRRAPRTPRRYTMPQWLAKVIILIPVGMILALAPAANEVSPPLAMLAVFVAGGASALALAVRW